MKLFNYILFFMFITICSLNVYSQNATLKGFVDLDSKEAAFNATIVLKGINKGSRTDLSGKYEINGIPPGKYSVECRMVNYQTIEVELEFSAGEVKSKDFSLKKSNDLEEVVLIGYGTTRTKDLTGSATIINEKNFLQGSLSSPEQLIMGKVAGLKVNSNDGAPGSGSTIRLRGGTSINASNDPLIVVDGVPLDNGGIAGAANALSLINPNDIASFVILKDASATAIYGSRAANGVILITTKKGKKGDSPLRITFDTKNSISTIAKYADVLSGDSLRNLVNRLGTPAQAAFLGTANTDWQKEVFRTSFTTDNNVAITGGIKGLPYRLSFGNRTENGLLLRDQFMRNSLSLSLNPSILDNMIDLEINQKLVNTQSFFANRGALGAAYFDPSQEVLDPNGFGGYWEWLDNNGNPNTLSARNPLGLIMQREDQSDVWRYIANAKMTIHSMHLKGLDAVINAGTDQSEGAGFTSTPASSASGFFSDGSYNNYRSNKGNKLLEAYLNYNNSNDKGNPYGVVDITAGYSYQDWYSASPNWPTYNESQDSVISPAAANPFYTKNALLSFYSRLIYSFNDRYVFNAALRYDGSSRFSPESRWGLFPSMSAAWVVSEESFLKNVKSLNLLKLRFGYGVTGQQDGIGDYAYISNYYEGATTAQYAFGGQYYTVFRPGGFDANLRWEQTESYNFGLDFGILKDRFSGSLDLYQKNTTDLLAVVPVPAGTNFTNEILTNVGSMMNQGIEFSLNAGLFADKNNRLDLTFNVSHNINQVVKLAQIEDPNATGVLVGGISGGIGNTVQVHRVGYPTFSFLLYEQQYDSDGNFIEVNQQANIDINEDGIVDNLDKWKDIHAYIDRNNDGIINIEDRYVAAQVAPDIFIGGALNYRHKNWTFGVSFRSEIGGHVYNNVHSNNGTFQSINGTQGFISNISSLYYVDEVQRVNTNQLLSDHYLERADFLRFDYFNVGYDFGKIKALNQKVGLRASLIVQNAFVLTNYSGLDPEIGGGIDNNIYPRPRMYSLNLTFDF